MAKAAMVMKALKGMMGPAKADVPPVKKKKKGAVPFAAFMKPSK